MNKLLALIGLALVFLPVGCSATSYQVQVSYSPMKDCDITAKVFGN